MNVELHQPTNSSECKRCDLIRELLVWPTSPDIKTSNQTINDTDDLHLQAEVDTMGLVVGLNIK